VEIEKVKELMTIPKSNAVQPLQSHAVKHEEDASSSRTLLPPPA
jgi:hypothetical protein